MGVSKGTTRESPTDEEERAGGVETGGVEGRGGGDLEQEKIESQTDSETKPEVVRRNLETCTRRKRREVGGEEEGRVAGKRDRDGDTGARGRTSEAGGVETADQVEEGALESKEEDWGANSVDSEEVESAGWKTTGEKNDLMKVWPDEVTGCFFFLCCFGLRGRGGRGEA